MTSGRLFGRAIQRRDHGSTSNTTAVASGAIETIDLDGDHPMMGDVATDGLASSRDNSRISRGGREVIGTQAYSLRSSGTPNMADRLSMGIPESNPSSVPRRRTVTLVGGQRGNGRQGNLQNNHSNQARSTFVRSEKLSNRYNLRSNMRPGSHRRVTTPYTEDGMSSWPRRTVVDRLSMIEPTQGGNVEGRWKNDKFEGVARVGSTIFIRHLPSLIVGNGPTDGLETKLTNHFSPVGPVVGIKINRSTMPSAQVYFMRSGDAAKAVEQLSGKPLTNYGGNIVMNFREMKERRRTEAEGEDRPVPTRKVVKTVGTVIDDEAWMCDSRSNTRAW